MPTAHGDSFRRPTLLERLGERLRVPFSRFPLRGRLRAAYHWMMLAATRGRGLEAHLPGGEVIHVMPEYRYVTWNEDEYRAFKQAIRPGGVALDIGANVGCYAVLLGQLVSPGGRVFAFEPSPAAYDGLVRHIALNHLEDVVVPVPAAVADREGTGVLMRSGPTGTDRLASAQEGGGGSEVGVTVTTIDRFCAARGIRPDFIKVDVEGAELAVLEGARGTIEANRNGLSLFVEMHPALWPLLGVSSDAMRAELARQHLRIRTLSATQEPWGREGECVRVLLK